MLTDSSLHDLPVTGNPQDEGPEDDPMGSARMLGLVLLISGSAYGGLLLFFVGKWIAGLFQ